MSTKETRSRTRAPLGDAKRAQVLNLAIAGVAGLAAFALAASPAPAQVYWTGDGADDSWFTPDNWTGADPTFGGLPYFFDQTIINNGDTVYIDGPGATAGSLFIGDNFATDDNPNNAGLGGTLIFDTGDLTTASEWPSVAVGTTGPGTAAWIQNSGSVEAGSFFIVAQQPDTVGSFDMSGGSIEAPIFFLGDNGTATGTMSGGTITLEDSFFVGLQPISTGDFAISDDAVINTRSFFVGDFGQGTTTMTDGTINAQRRDEAPGDVLIGAQPSAVGVLNLDGGDINVEDNFLVGFFATGERNDEGVITTFGGTLNQTGGQIIAGGNYSVATAAGDAGRSTGAVTQSGGYTEGLDVHIGQGGDAFYTMTGGTLAARQDVILGEFGFGFLNQLESAEVTGETVLVGAFGRGEHHINGGTVDTTRFMSVGIHDPGSGVVFQRNDAVVTTPGLMVGERGVGEYFMEGGLLNVVGNDLPYDTFEGPTGNLIVGRDGSGDAVGSGSLTHTGGTITVGTPEQETHVYVGDLANSTGFYLVGGNAELVVHGDLSVGGALSSIAPPDDIRTGDEGQAPGVTGIFVVSGSGATIDIRGDLLVNPADRTIEGDPSLGALVFDLFDDTGTSLIDVTGVADLDGAEINLQLIDDYAPEFGTVFDLLTASAFGTTGTGTTQNTGDGTGFYLHPDDLGMWDLDVVSGGNGVVLQATFIPEPVSIASLAGALGMLTLRRRTRRG